MRNVHHASRLEAQMLRLTSAAVAGVFVLAVVNWTGWATGRSRLTRFLADWPVMTPWTAALVAAVGLAILLQSGRPPRTRCESAAVLHWQRALLRWCSSSST